MRILITGGTGFIGQELVRSLIKSGDEILVKTRNIKKAQRLFKDKIIAVKSFDEISADSKIDVIINLAGEGIADKKWDDKQKAELINSRVNITSELIGLIAKLDTKPKQLINGSAIGYYGSHGDKILNEESKPNQEFTHDLCQKWEDEALKAKELGVKIAIIRLGVVLGNDGGTIKKMATPFKMGLGGQIGNGQQYFSWVHIDDVVNAINYLKDNDKEGIFNLTSPNAVTNREFTKSFGKAINRPTIFPMPALMVKTLFGEMGKTLLLSGQRVYPENLLQAGFEFKFETIDEALNEIF